MTQVQNHSNPQNPQSVALRPTPYLLTEALGQSLTRAFTALDLADAPAIRLSLTYLRSDQDLARHPKLRAFLETALRMADSQLKGDVDAALRHAAQWRKVLNRAKEEGLPLLAYDVLLRRLAIFERQYDEALRGLSAVITRIDRALATRRTNANQPTTDTTGSPTFDKYLQTTAHYTRYLAETGAQASADEPVPAFEFGHFEEDLPFGTDLWHQRLLNTAKQFEKVLEAQFWEQEAAREAEAEDAGNAADAAENDGDAYVVDFEVRLANMLERGSKLAGRVVRTVFPQVTPLSYSTLKSGERAAIFADLMGLADTGDELSVKCALALCFLRIPDYIALAPEFHTKPVEDGAKMILAEAFLRSNHPAEKLPPLPRELSNAFRSPELDRWLSLLRVDNPKDALLRKTIEAETHPTLKAFYGELEMLNDALDRYGAALDGKPLRTFAESKADVKRLLNFMEAHPQSCNYDGLRVLIATTEAYALATELRDDEPQTAAELLRASLDWLSALTANHPSTEHPFFCAGAPAAFATLIEQTAICIVAAPLGVNDFTPSIAGDLDDEDFEEYEYEYEFEYDDEDAAIDGVPHLIMRNEEPILPAKYANENVIATRFLLETESPVVVFMRSLTDDITFTVYTNTDFELPPECGDPIVLTANQLANLRPEVIGLFQKPSVMQGVFVRENGRFVHCKLRDLNDFSLSPGGVLTRN